MRPDLCELLRCQPILLSSSATLSLMLASAFNGQLNEVVMAGLVACISKPSAGFSVIKDGSASPDGADAVAEAVVAAGGHDEMEKLVSRENPEGGGVAAGAACVGPAIDGLIPDIAVLAELVEELAAGSSMSLNVLSS